MKLIACLIMLLTGSCAFSQNWTGNADSDWNNSANWSSWPLSGQDLTIDPANYTGNAASPVISSNSVFSPAEVTVQNGASLTISANLATQDDFTATGAGTQVIMTGGTFQVNPGNGGRLIIDLGALMVLQNGDVQVDERFIAGEDATVVINGGTATSGERLLMDLGGHFIQNGGTVSVAETFAMADGNANGSSRYEIHGGTLSITGEMAFENETGNFEPEFFITSGNLVLNGDMTWFGEAPGSGTPRFTAFGGSITVVGTIENLPLSTVDMYIDLNGTATMTYNGPAITLLHATDTIRQTAASTLTIIGTNTITNPGVIVADNNVMTNFLGTTTLTGSGSCDLASVLIQGGGTLSLQQTLGIKNNWQNNGAFNGNSEEVYFHGSVPQLILGSTETNFYGLHIANASGLELQQNTFVNGTLNLELGNITTSAAELLTLNNDAQAQNGSAQSFVNGPLCKIGDDAFLFPIGKGSVYGPCEITAPPVETARHDAEYFPVGYSNTTAVNAPLSSVSSSQYWQLSATGPNVQLSLHWNDASLAGITDCAGTTVARWNGTAWNNQLSMTSGSCSGSGSGFVQTDQALNADGIFTFGFFENASEQNYQLCYGDSINISGSFYSEDTTIIEVIPASGGGDSTVISHVDVAAPFDLNVSLSGSTLTGSPDADSWQWLDCDNGFAPVPGANSSQFTPVVGGSYALVLTQNTCLDTTACIAVTLLGIGEQPAEAVRLYPNPATSGFSIRGFDGTARVQVFAADGARCLQVSEYQQNMRIGQELGHGVYFVKITTAQGVSTHKLVVAPE